MKKPLERLGVGPCELIGI